MRADILERYTVLRVLAYLLTIIAALVAGGMIWGVVAHFQDIILMLFLAWMIAFILQPLVSLVERWGLSRLAAVAIIYCALLMLVVASIVLAIPLMQSQITHAASALTALVSPGNVRYPRLKPGACV
jgi:predicted PurR-regulated permease PerM